METPAMSTPDVESVLRRQIEMMEAEMTRLRNNSIEYIQHIGDCLIEEAENRGWCQEYDEFVDGVNTKLPAEYQLPVRKMDTVVELTYSVTIKIDVDDVPKNIDEGDLIDRARQIAERDSYGDRYDGFSHSETTVSYVEFADGRVDETT
jgi:hypothetical protein